MQKKMIFINFIKIFRQSIEVVESNPFLIKFNVKIDSPFIICIYLNDKFYKKLHIIKNELITVKKPIYKRWEYNCKSERGIKIAIFLVWKRKYKVFNLVDVWFVPDFTIEPVAFTIHGFLLILLINLINSYTTYN